MENQETPNQENQSTSNSGTPNSGGTNSGTPNFGTPPPTPHAETINRQFENVFSGQFGQQPIPNATGVLVCGIISLPICFCYVLCGIPGLILSIVSLVLYKKSREAYDANPSLYTQASFNNLKAGRVCAIIGLILNILCLLGMIAYIAFFVTMFKNGFMGNHFFK